MSLKFSIIVFPGSNCDQDCRHALQSFPNVPVQMIWHKETSLGDTDVVILPGGFSYGDYLRCGAIAKFSPIMKEVIVFAKKGGYVMGVCNGFQILTEMGLLPGILMRNQNLKFVCETVRLKVVNSQIPYTRKIGEGHAPPLQMPIAHGEGNYFIDPLGLKGLHDNNQIVFQYADSPNPNGSLDNIAGICSENGRVLGMMPHPERASDPLLGGTDGRLIFESLLS